MKAQQQTLNKKTQARGNARREILLESATELLKTLEFNEISMADVAKHAGIPTASCYTLFANTNVLFSALTNKYSLQMTQVMAMELEAKSFNSWREFVDACCDLGVTFYNNHPAYRRIMLSGKAPSEVRYSENRVVASEKAKHFFEAMSERFNLPELDNPILILTVMLDLVDGIISSGYIRDNKISPEIIREAKRAAYGYLSLYLPDYIPLKPLTTNIAG